MNLSNLRILPLMVMVAFLAFSVRLADFAMGVRSLSQQAQAEEKAQEESPAAKPADAPKPEETQNSDGGLKIEGAQDNVAHDQKPADKPAAAGKPKVKAPAWQDPKDIDPAFTSMQMEVFEDLSSRRKQLDQREKEVQTREALLQAAQKELEQKFTELTRLRGEIEKLLKQQTDEEQAQITSLVKIYEGMKPKDAARIFNTLDIDILSEVMTRMSERKLSPIMAEMDPERAKTITVILAEQKKLPSLPPVE